MAESSQAWLSFWNKLVPMQDSQQKAVYAWEDKWTEWNRANASKRRIQVAIRRAERKYGVSPTTIFFPKRDRGSVVDRRSNKGRRIPSHYDPDAHAIRLRPRHCNVAIALHEVAHAIHDWFFGSYPTPKTEAHGPLWLGIYIWLLVDAQLAPKSALLTSAKEAGIKWAPLGKVAPRKIRYAYRGLVDKAEF